MINKKYTAEFKFSKVKEYIKESKNANITKADFATSNGIVDSTFNE